MAPRRALAYARHHRPRFLAELKDFIRFPTISSQPEHAGDLKKCAAWLARSLQRAGLENVKIIPTRGHPIKLVPRGSGRPGLPTVLVYGHYDVVPVDPLQEWHTPPFPSRRSGRRRPLRKRSLRRQRATICPCQGAGIVSDDRACVARQHQVPLRRRGRARQPSLRALRGEKTAARLAPMPQSYRTLACARASTARRSAMLSGGPCPWNSR